MLCVFLSLGTTGLLSKRHKYVLIFAVSFTHPSRYASAVRTFLIRLSIYLPMVGIRSLVCDRTHVLYGHQPWPSAGCENP